MEHSGDEDREETGGGEDVAVGEIDQLDDAVDHRVSDCHERVDGSKHERVLELVARQREPTLLDGDEYRHHDRANDHGSEVPRDDVVGDAHDRSEGVQRPACLAFPRCQSVLRDERTGCASAGHARLS